MFNKYSYHNLFRQCVFFRKLQHQNIAEFIGSFLKQEKEHLYLVFVTKFYTKTLLNLIQPTSDSEQWNPGCSKSSFSYGRCLKSMCGILVELCNVLHFLHDKSFVHGGLTPEHILVCIIIVCLIIHLEWHSFQTK